MTSPRSAFLRSIIQLQDNYLQTLVYRVAHDILSQSLIFVTDQSQLASSVCCPDVITSSFLAEILVKIKLIIIIIIIIITMTFYAEPK